MEKTKMRVSQDHWRIILDFAELHPEIITNKFSSHLQGKQSNKLLWDQLTLKLNCLGQGKRSAEEWKKTLADWKSKTKKKASENNKDFEKTGGGPAASMSLTVLEERLIALMGKTAIFGDATVQEKGIKRKANELHQDASGSTISIVETIEPLIEHNLYEEEYVVLNKIINNDHNYLYNTRTIDVGAGSGVIAENEICQEAGSTNERNIESNPNKAIRKGNKTEGLREMHADILGVLQKIECSIYDMSNALKNIASSLNMITEHFVNKS